ncbi:MAG: ribosome assembly cofactor RimP [Flavobacteriaceae bacterium]|nr:ribosome assembly cofactor RimP [Bacteroidia bacterium]MBT8288106.1 ribosome assembly cofactor RimP [Bacteroidia bacterium]NNF74311.1 ribosome assembly cofactor RimP [Flavobacteriaceae bacterium]NNK71962.1 ribosome assembly cofactor RimP [Flavobacteriaceae bacterium]
MLVDIVQSALEAALKSRPDLFLIDLIVDESNKIRVVIDADKGVVVDDCVFISRQIEGELDRDEIDFSLEVTSAGANSPLEHVRQYKKNIGRSLEVTTTANEHIVAELVSADETGITLNWKVREPKPIGKGKVTVKKEAVLNYKDIEKAKVKIKF